MAKNQLHQTLTDDPFGIEPTHLAPHVRINTTENGESSVVAQRVVVLVLSPAEVAQPNPIYPSKTTIAMSDGQLNSFKGLGAPDGRAR